jgi:hypothetical protein
MRQEAWDLLQNLNRYSSSDSEKNWVAFCAQINKVEQEEETQEDQKSANSDLAGRLQAATGRMSGGN